MKSYFIGKTLFKYPGYESSTVEECVKYLNKQKVIGLDIETGRKYKKGTYNESIYKPGLDPYTSRIVMLQIGTLESRFIIDARYIDLTPLKEIFENDKILKVGHNLKFEGKFLLHTIGSHLNNVWDTMIVEKCLYNGYNIRYSLEALCERYFGTESVQHLDLFTNTSEDEDTQYIDKSTRLGFIEIGDTPFTITQIKYGEEDIIFPLKIYQKQKQGRLVNGELYLPKVGINIENIFTQALASVELQGLNFCKETWLNIYEEAKSTYIYRKSILDAYVVENYPIFSNPPDLFSKTRTCNIEWTSSQQVIKLFVHIGICPMEKSKSTGKQSYTVGAKAMFKLLKPEQKKNFYKNNFLDEIKSTEDLILNYLLLKKSEQSYTTFGKDWLKYVHPITKKVHTNFNQYMNTGRLSSNEPNLQNIPNGNYRNAFKASAGFKIINCDFSGQELRILAEISNNKDMLLVFNEGHPRFGDDLHALAGTNIFRKLYKDDTYIVSKATPKERGIAKNFNFKINYGGSAYTLSQELDMSIEETDTLIQLYFDGFPGLEDNFTKAKELAVKRGWIELDKFTKKRYFFPYFKEMKELEAKAWSYYPSNYMDLSSTERAKVKAEINKKNPILKSIWSKYFYYKGKLERKALNYRIQGAAASMTKIAGILIYREILKNPSIGFISNFIHDEINGGATIENSQEFARIVSECMVKAGTYICKNVKMKADAVISDVWEH